MTPSPRPAAILVAGGRGERARSGADDIPKQFRPLGGRPLISWSYDVLRAAGCDPVVVVAPDEFHDLVRSALGARTTLASAGDDRQGSVRNGLEEVDSEIVVIHDAVRPFVTAAMVTATLQALDDHDGAIIAAPVDETIKRVEGSTVVGTVDRTGLWRAQTPQSFRTAALKKAHREAVGDDRVVTDDAALLEFYGGSVVVVPGDNRNLKITYPEDFALAEAHVPSGDGVSMRIGQGFDVHAFAPEGRSLVIGGVKIPHDRGLSGHSDADVLSHAVADALLGAARLGDLGSNFPGDDRWKDSSSLSILEETARMIGAAGYVIANVDASVIAETPRMAPYRDEMASNIAVALGIDEHLVSVKATTTDGLGAIGRGEGIAAMAVVALERR